MVLAASLLKTLHYKVWIKGKVEQSKESSSALQLHLGVVAIERGTFGSPLTVVANVFLMIERDKRELWNWEKNERIWN